MLKKGVPFHWDEISQKEFDSLKYFFIQESLLYTPDYQCDYFLYLATTFTTITMVLVQKENVRTENPIYYLSHNMNDTEIKYTHIKKLTLVVVQVVQRFHHYILLRKTMVFFDYNPMKYILSRQSLGGEYSTWIVFLQEFDLEFIKSNSKKSLVFAEVICDLHATKTETMSDNENSITDESLFLID